MQGLAQHAIAWHQWQAPVEPNMQPPLDCFALQELPDTVFSVGTGARTLDATNNKLTTVSPQLAQLSNLSRLVLTSNQIQEVPAAILQLQYLKVRYAGDLDLSAPAGSRGGLAM